LIDLSHIAIFNKRECIHKLCQDNDKLIINYSKDLLTKTCSNKVIFYEYRDIAINNVKDLSDNKIDDKKNLLTNLIFLEITINNINNTIL